MTTKKAKFPTPKRTDFSPAEQHCAMLISALDGNHSEYNPATVAKYHDRARQMLRSPHAFTGMLDALNVTDLVVNDALRQDRAVGSDQRAYHQMVAAIFDGDEREMVTASAMELRGMGYHAISEATLYGAALMFELLKGGFEVIRLGELSAAETDLLTVFRESSANDRTMLTSLIVEWGVLSPAHRAILFKMADALHSATAWRAGPARDGYPR